MAATYEPIATTSVSGTSSFSFASIPATYTDLRLIIISRSSAGGGTSSRLFITFNNDTATNYSQTLLGGDGATAYSNRLSTQAEIGINPGSAGSGATSGIFGFSTLDVFSYAGSKNKTVLATSSLDRNGAGNVTRQVGLWRSTAAINRVTVTDESGNNFASGTTATIYGIKAA